MEVLKPKSRIWILVLIAVLSILTAELFKYSAVFQTMELKVLDMRFGMRGTRVLDQPPIAVIAIDDQSDESTPDRWPWRRSYYAHVIENLQEAGAAVIGLDLILDKGDLTNPGSDDTLAAVLKKYDNVVLTGKLLRSFSTGSMSTIIEPYGKFMPSNSRWGLAALEADLDGFYRRYPLAQTYEDSLYPSLAAEVLLAALPPDEDRRIRIDEDNFYIGPYTVPKFDEYNILINYAGPAHSFPYYSFDTILDDRDFKLREEFDLNSFDDPGDEALGLPPGLKYSGFFKDKIVLIGSTMQELHDNFPTPFLEYRTSDGQSVRAEMPGVEIHANTIYTILSGDYLTKMSDWLIFFIMVFMTALAFLSTRYLKAALSGIAMLLVIFAYIVIVFAAFLKFNLILAVHSPLLAAIFSFIGYTVYNYILTQQEKKMLRGVFAHYVPESVIQEIMDNPDKLSLGGEERVITVLFTDIAGFTTISESMTPRELVAILNEYLTEMTNIVLENDGIIDKFEGDAVMAEFGVPVTFPGHAKAACLAALQMQNRLKKLRREWVKQGKPEIRMRVGVNTGEVIVGNMGSRDVFDYTVMGDHVNLGARLESANKFYGTNIMISEFTYEEVKDDFFTRPLDLIRVKGKNKPIAVYELLAEKTTKFSDMFFQFIEYYEQGIDAYRSKKWAAAISLFERCLKLNQDDKPAALYLQRSREYQKNPPPDDWDGVTTLTEK